MWRASTLRDSSFRQPEEQSRHSLAWTFKLFKFVQSSLAVPEWCLWHCSNFNLRLCEACIGILVEVGHTQAGI